MQTKPVSRLIFGYAIFVTLFTTLMVGFSIASPTNFFASYGISVEPAFAFAVIPLSGHPHRHDLRTLSAATRKAFPDHHVPLLH